MRALEHEHRLATRERETLEAAEARMRQREDALRQREETFRKRLNEELDTQVRQARREIDDVIAQLKAKTAAIAQDGAARRVDRRHRSGAQRRARRGRRGRRSGSLEPAERRPSAEPPPPDASRHAVGDRVVVGGLGLEGVVTAVHDGTADLDVRGKRMRASVRDLRVVGAARGAGARHASTCTSSCSRARRQPADLNVIGCSVDEAIARAERFLDESLLGDQRIVRLIHGYGTGQLKRALAGFLQQHPAGRPLRHRAARNRAAAASRWWS